MIHLKPADWMEMFVWSNWSRNHPWTFEMALNWYNCTTAGEIDNVWQADGKCSAYELIHLAAKKAWNAFHGMFNPG